MVEGGDQIRKMDWESVGGILQQGGTIIGTARSEAFRTHEGRRKAALNLIQLGIDGLIVIGGDGSLTGAYIFREEVARFNIGAHSNGQISAEIGAAHPTCSSSEWSVP